MSLRIYNALIRTHHITSRKKVATLKAATKKLECHALLRSGGVPGVMFVEGKDPANVQRWVDIVRSLRYKDYQLLSAVSEALSPAESACSDLGSLHEVSSVNDLGARMGQRGLTEWWRTSMGFTPN